MKDKNVAGILSLFLGWAGIHRFYLGQVGLGIFYCILIPTGIAFLLGLIDAISFFSMDQERFDVRYNRKFIDLDYRRQRDTDFDRREYRRRTRNEYRRDPHQRRGEEQWERNRRERRERPGERQTSNHPEARKANPHKEEGKKLYKDFDYEGAIEAFNQALEIEPRDIATHFNLACAYSLTEQAEKAFYHLDKAVSFGFKDFQRIREHDALAFLRVQDAFDAFSENNFRIPAGFTQPGEEQKTATDSPIVTTEEQDNLLDQQPNLLDQIKKLGDLRAKGLLTEEEFVEQKRKLLG